jgi:hypothetical protein
MSPVLFADGDGDGDGDTRSVPALHTLHTSLFFSVGGEAFNLNGAGADSASATDIAYSGGTIAGPTAASLVGPSEWHTLREAAWPTINKPTGLFEAVRTQKYKVRR